MFRTVFVAFWILHVKLSASAPPTDNAVIQREATVSHPFLTAAKFVPFTTGPSENAGAQLKSVAAIELPVQTQQNSANHVPDKSPISRVPSLDDGPTDGTGAERLPAGSSPLPADPRLGTVPESSSTLPFPYFAFDPKVAISRKLIAPEPNVLVFEEPIRLSEPPAGQSQLPADVKLAPVPKVPAAARLSTEILPPKQESLAELVDTLSSGGYGILASQRAAVLNTSTVNEDLPLVFERLSKAHSPKKDVEVFAPPQPEKPSQSPFLPPSLPGGPPYPFPPDGSYPSDETPFVVNEYPGYPQFVPEESPFPTLPPTTRSPEENTRPTEDMTRATEETTPKLPKSTTTVPKITPWVPKNTPHPPKNTPWVPKNTPPPPPKYTPPRQPSYTQDAGGHSWITKFYPGYPPTTKQPKGMPSPIWPMFTPRPAVPAQGANLAGMVTPFMQKLISATSTASTPSVEVLGEPSTVEPKYKLAVVSDYKNYDPHDGSFGFSIDLENGLTAKVRGYKKEGRHFIEGSYSLFANEGDPVNITYIADNEAPEAAQQFEQAAAAAAAAAAARASNTAPSPVPAAVPLRLSSSTSTGPLPQPL